MSILTPEEIDYAVMACVKDSPAFPSVMERRQAVAKAQAKKILIKLQKIYNLPDGGMFHKKMGEFIQSLIEEVNG